VGKIAFIRPRLPPARRPTLPSGRHPRLPLPPPLSLERPRLRCSLEAEGRDQARLTTGRRICQTGLDWPTGTPPPERHGLAAQHPSPERRGAGLAPVVAERLRE